MNAYLGPDRRNPGTDRRAGGSLGSDAYVRADRDGENNEERGLRGLFLEIWEGHTWILGCLGLFLVLGLFSIWNATPVYQSQSLLQLLAKHPEPTTEAANTRPEDLFNQPLEAEAEIEILNSNLLLGNVIRAQKLDFVARPKALPLIGAALLRHSAHPARMVVADYHIPDELRGCLFGLTAKADGGFTLYAPEEPVPSARELPGQKLAEGRPGETTFASFNGRAFQFRLDTLAGKPGQKYLLGLTPMAVAIDSMRLAFDASEKGRLTNVIGLTYKCDNRLKSMDVLNEIMKQYILLKIQRRNAESVQTLAVLQEKMPALKAEVDRAESRLNEFRSRSGSVDINHEGSVLLDQGNALTAQISALRQHKEELLRTYAPTADVVTTVDQQLSKLIAEAARNDAKVRTLPQTEQTVVSLTRDVQVNTALYTALLNNIQQLQVTTAGNIGNVSVVDAAMCDPDPISPRKAVILTLFLFLGLCSGIGLSKVRKLLSPGVEDHRLIETKLGIPVLVTVPHSSAQKKHQAAMRERQGGNHLLGKLDPEDLAVESLRSLRTSLTLSLKSAANNLVMVTGPAPAIGKSFISANLAFLFAQTGSRVLVVDGDLRRGGMHRFFGVSRRVGGLSEVLAGRADWQTMVQPVLEDPTRPGEDQGTIPGLFLLSSGVLPPNPSELLMSDRFSNFLAEAAKLYDIVIVDSPPLLSVTDATIIGSKMGAVLMVARYGQHPLDELRTCQRRLSSHGIRLTGCVFNDVAVIAKGYKYAYHYAYK